MEITCCCCPAIEDLSVCNVSPADVRAMASLMRLNVLEVSNHDAEQGPELAEAFTTLGNTEGATPLTRLKLRFITFDATGFFSSRRCSALRDLELFCCDKLTDQAMQALATNVCDSLVALVCISSSVAPIVPLLAGCRRIERLTLYRCINNAGIRTIGKTCKAPLRFVKITGRTTDNGDAVRAIMPALAGVVFLHVGCSAEAVLQHIIPQCPCLQVLRVCSPDIAKQLRSVIPKHITVWP
jgi:hypothetical protein